MPKIDINIDPKVFNESFLPFLKDETFEQVYFGGSSSGKSKFLAQRCIHDLLKGGRNYLSIRNVSTTLRTSIFNELKKVIGEWSVRDLFTIFKSEMSITCKNGYQALLKGLDDVEKIKSIVPEKGVITDILVEEATETSETDIRQLKRRLRGKASVPKRVSYSFNPILRTHWLYKSMFKNWDDDKNLLRDSKKLLVFKSTYKDNRFLDDQDIKFLESEKDEYFYNVYTLGNWGVLGDVIFKNWKVQDVLNSAIYKVFDQFRNGLDFGYSEDPAAFNRCFYHKKKKTIYIFKEFQQRGLTNDRLADKLKPIIGKETVYCDSSEPKSIQELIDNGINAMGAIKGKDSIHHGIQWLQQQNIIIDRTCQHTKNEFEQYQWKKDKYGESLPVPLDRDNHHIDNIRYAFEDEMSPPKRIIPRMRII